MVISKTKRNIGYSIIYKVVSMIVPLVTSPYLSRTLGPDKTGEYNYISSIAFYFFYFAMLGVNDYGNREVARARESKEKLSDTFWQIYYMQFFLTIVSTLIYFMVVQIYLRDYLLVGMLTGLYVLSAAIDINWFLYGCEKFKYCSIVFLLQKICVLFGIIIFVKEQSDLWKYALIVNGNLIAFTLLFWPIAIRETYFRKPDFKAIIRHIRPNLVLFLPIIASSIYNQMDKIMMGGHGSKAEIGFYSFAENIINVFISVAVAVNAVMLPKSSLLVEKGDDKTRNRLLYKTSYFMNAINIGIVFGTLSISYYLIPWYLGPKYVESARLLNILVPTVFLIGVSGIVRSQFLIPNRDDSIYITSILGGAIINFLLNLYMIPHYGATGASITTIVAYGVVLVIQGYYTRKQINYMKIVIESVPFLLFGVIMFLFVSYIPEHRLAIITILIKGMLGFIIYLMQSLLWNKVCRKLRKN